MRTTTWCMYCYLFIFKAMNKKIKVKLLAIVFALPFAQLMQVLSSIAYSGNKSDYQVFIEVVSGMCLFIAFEYLINSIECIKNKKP